MSEFKQTIDIKKIDFKRVFNEYFPSLCVFANKFVNDEDVAKDMVQDVFLKIWSSGKVFKSEKSMRVYFYLTTKNRAIDYLKRERNKNNISDTHTLNIIDDNLIIDEIIQEETYRLLGNALSLLPDKAQKVMLLNLEGLSNIEIADQLGISINTVKYHKLYAFRELRKKLGNKKLSIFLALLV